RPAPHDAGPSQPGAPGHRQTAALRDRLVGDDVHVQVGPGLAGHGRADAGAEDVLPGLAARGPQHDLGGVGAAGEGEQGARDVVADDVVEGAAQVLHQGALLGEFAGRGGGEAVATCDVDGQHLAPGALLGQPDGPADQGAALGAAGEADDDPFAGAPDRGHVVLAAVALEVLVDAVGDPQEGEFPEGGEVA